MKTLRYPSLFLITVIILLITGCQSNSTTPKASSDKSAAELLGNPDFLAMSYGGYRTKTREVQPSLEEIKEDLMILQAMGIKIIRTYNVQLEQASNILKAIKALKGEHPNFEMYVMLGAWINCENAWTAHPNHNAEDEEANTLEINRAVALAKAYPDIVKILAVGNEAMVHWAASYFVQPNIILKWVNHLQALKKQGQLPESLWITSSDNFASWGGGDVSYHKKDLEALIKAVDYVSVHTYPFHDTHYNPSFWGISLDASTKMKKETIDEAMKKATDYAVGQYQSVKTYIDSLGISKPIHIGESGWASVSNGFYGNSGSRATDEYKQALYYKQMRSWSQENKVALFYFEAFDEPWKDASNPSGSENHFGLFTVEGKAKYALWDAVEKGTFKGLSRNGQSISKTFSGDKTALMKTVFPPPIK